MISYIVYIKEDCSRYYSRKACLVTRIIDQTFVLQFKRSMHDAKLPKQDDQYLLRWLRGEYFSTETDTVASFITREACAVLNVTVVKFESVSQ